MKPSLAFGCAILAVLPLVASAPGSGIAGGLAAPTLNQGRPGGDTTYLGEINRRALSHPASNLRPDQWTQFEVGRGLFKRRWVAAPPSVPTAAAGLGPLFNARSCEGCHLDDGRGQPFGEATEGTGSMVMRLSIPPRTDAEREDLAARRIKTVPEPSYGTQIQTLGIPGQFGEGSPVVTYRETPVTLGDGSVVSLREPSYAVLDLGYGPLDAGTQMSPRVAPALIGLGLLEAVDANALLYLADPDDADGDGISGRPNLVWSREHGRVLLGRFGWKAGEATLSDQTQAALAVDLGISAPLYPSDAGDCTQVQRICLQATRGTGRTASGPEADGETVAALVFYTRNLAVPARREPDHPEVLAGRQLFADLGCARCHRPSLQTGVDERFPEQSGQQIWPYTDLLLHDMGDGLADGRPEGDASGREWRTAPLWGIGLTQTVSGHSLFLHDGRARSLVEAILWHGGEAQRSRDAFAALATEDRNRLLRFVESL